MRYVKQKRNICKTNFAVLLEVFQPQVKTNYHHLPHLPAISLLTFLYQPMVKLERNINTITREFMHIQFMCITSGIWSVLICRRIVRWLYNGADWLIGFPSSAREELLILIFDGARNVAFIILQCNLTIFSVPSSFNAKLMLVAS